MSAEELEEACRRDKVKAVFTVPSMHNPSVVTMSETRRRELVDIAERHDLIIIEDDVYGPMLSSRPPAIVTLAPERTYHISALSKALAPGLRVGYLTCPPGQAMVMAEAVRTTAWMPAPLPLLVASRWLEDGTANAILKAQLAELRARHSAGDDNPRRAFVQRRSALHVRLAETAGALAVGGLLHECPRPRRRGHAVDGLCQRPAVGRACRQGQCRLRCVARGTGDGAAHHRLDARRPPPRTVRPRLMAPDEAGSELTPLPEPERKNIIVVGAGLVGLCSALWLQKFGHRVTIIDRDPPLPGASWEQACSYGNACTVALHGVVPVATPGVAWRVPGMLLNPLGPLAIVWRYLPHLVPWLRAFLASSSKAEVERVAGILACLMRHADAGWRPLIEEAGAKHLERHAGCLYLYKTEAQFQAAEYETGLRERHGVALGRLDADAIRDLEPNLAPLYHRGVLFRDAYTLSTARKRWLSRLPTRF